MLRCAVVAALSLSFAAVLAPAQTAPIQITADLTDAPRKLFHADVDLPAKPGAAAFITPQWIPGHHSPSGPVGDIVGVTFTAGGNTLPWRRDDVNLYEYHVTVPAGTTSVHAHLDYIASGRITTNMAVLEWEKLLLYPANVPVSNIPVQATVIVPQGWGIGTSLKPVTQYDPQHPAGGKVTYAPTTVELLEDSPIMTGQYFHEYALATELPVKHYMDVFGDEAADVALRPKVVDGLSDLVREAWAMYGSHHYDSYHFLLTLTQKGGGGGLEHHESSDNGQPEFTYANDDNLALGNYLLPHEFTHSWNGKYRRPAGLATPDYAQPMKGELLWVYEGLTDYMGNVLGARIGWQTPEVYRGWLAMNAATLDAKGGRAWRSTQDTAISVSVLRGGPGWANLRRGTDYYQEGDMLWLDVDTTIRKLTDDKKSLHDFMLVFTAKGGSTGPKVVPYDWKELVDDLNSVVKYDWDGFLKERVNDVTPHVDLKGVEQGGYKLVYNDRPSAYESLLLKQRGSIDVWFSLGLQLDNDGNITDVRVGSPADKARINPGMKILAVNGRMYTKGLMVGAVRESKTSTAPLRFILQNDTYALTADVDYHGGEQYPDLARVESAPAYLDEITAPMVKTP